MLGRSLMVTALLLVGSCNPGTGPAVTNPGTGPAVTAPLAPKVNPDLKPAQSAVLDAQGNSQPVAASRDEQGVQSDFIEGVVIVRPQPGADLQAFLDRYEGTVIRNDTIPEPPPELGITLTAEQRKPTEYVVRINLAKVDASSFVANATAAGVTGVMEFSSEPGMLTLAGVADAVATGFDASPDYLSYPDQAFPAVLNSTRERTTDGVVADAFNTTRFGTGGSQSNVTMAWQFLSAHGIQRPVRVAIIDRGFWLNTNGTPRSATDSDFAAGVPTQYDFDGDDPFADGPNGVPCTPKNPCFWHGTGAAGVAMGLLNNNAGAAGTGGQVGDPMLFRSSGDRGQVNWAIRTAVAWGADVVSLSMSADCDLGCRKYDRKHTPFDDAVDAGSRTVFVSCAGNAGKDVDDPNFVHPCTEDHVICVGALADDATTKIGYSNFGGHVQIFAPTNIPVMSYPMSTDAAGKPLPISMAFGVEQTQTFGGTSAAAPFVAGVAAMMKAINPNLNGDEVATILRDTAHPGAGDVSRYIDAYAAVRRAAEGIPAVKDRLENNDLEKGPTNLGAAASYTQSNLNLDRANDLDYFRFDVPSSSIMTVDIQYMQLLGSMDLTNLQALGACAAPVYFSDEGLSGNGHRFQYRVSGGPLQFAVRGADINAYNLLISFAATESVLPDVYETNDLVSTAKYIRTLRSSSAKSRARSDARVTIDATIHNAADVDYYVVRGSPMSLAEQVLLVGNPAVTVYGNESPITIDVWQRNPDNTQGALVASVGGGSCTAQALSVRLDPDQFYIVRVTGGVGHYTLRNGIDTKKRDIDVLVQDPIYIILHPGDPIEHVLRFAEKYVFVADAAYSSVRVVGPGAHLRLLDSASKLVTEGVLNGLGESLSLASTVRDQVYALEVAPKDPGAEPPMLDLEWDPASPARTSANLIANAGAEIIVGPDPAQDVPYWDILLGTSRIFFYDNESPTTNPSLVGPGPSDRGMHLFAGGPNNTLSQLRQTINVDPAWQQAINDRRVKFDFSAFLGGLLGESDHTDASLTFLDANFQTLGQQALPSVTALDRDATTGLFPVEASDYLPMGTAFIYVNLVFQGGVGDYNDGYADNLELILSDYTPGP